jgi:DNA-binding transcriptional LysR family regulator
MTAVRIKPRLRLAVVGSPAYFEKRPMPKTPADLKHHLCIRNTYPSGVPYAWSFRRGDKEVDYQPTGPLSLDDHELMLEAALSGAALAYVWEDRARTHIENGRLIHCLAAWCPPEDWLYLYDPTRKYVSAGLRAVIKALRA